jgi:hypothetical protein
MQREMSRTYRTIPAAFTGTIIVPSLAAAQNSHTPAAVGDLMTAFVQTRHIKLGLARNEQN